MHTDEALWSIDFAGHLSYGERGGVRREDSVWTDPVRDIGEDLLLERHILKDGLNDEPCACHRWAIKLQPIYSIADSGALEA